MYVYERDNYHKYLLFVSTTVCWFVDIIHEIFSYPILFFHSQLLSNNTNWLKIRFSSSKSIIWNIILKQINVTRKIQNVQCATIKIVNLSRCPPLFPLTNHPLYLCLLLSFFSFVFFFCSFFFHLLFFFSCFSFFLAFYPFPTKITSIKQIDPSIERKTRIVRGVIMHYDILLEIKRGEREVENAEESARRVSSHKHRTKNFL